MYIFDKDNALINDLESLKTFTNPNMFDILGVSNTEIRHSYMLAWLLNPDENHELDDGVLRGWISRYADPGDLDNITIYREWNHIDLLAVSEKEHMILCIENKTLSGEHDDQLNRYRDYLESAFPGYKMVLIYLTPTGKRSSDPEHWHSMSYGDVLEIIEKAKEGKQLLPEVELILRNYIDVIKRIGGESIQSVCRRMYRMHQMKLERIWKEGGYPEYRKELALLKNNKPRGGSDPIADTITAWAEERGISVYRTSDAYIRFKTEFMSELLPDAENAVSGWGTGNFYFYEIRNMADKEIHEVWITLTINVKDMPENLKAMADRLNSLYPVKNNKTQNHSHFSTAHVR